VVDRQAPEITIRKLIFVSLIAAGAFFICGSRAQAQEALILEGKIQLGNIRGRIDHMAADLARHRLFVAQLENDSVSVIDFKSREIAHVITDVKGPQALGMYPPAIRYSSPMAAMDPYECSRGSNTALSNEYI
jgi:hypothetical protein